MRISAAEMDKMTFEELQELLNDLNILMEARKDHQWERVTVELRTYEKQMGPIKMIAPNGQEYTHFVFDAPGIISIFEEE